MSVVFPKTSLKDYPNGIYEITVDEYFNFYQSLMIPISAPKDLSNLVMIKRQDFYLFGMHHNDHFYLLEGKARHLAKHEPNYYYEHLLQYVQRIEEAFFFYNQNLQELSKEVQLIGGSGEIDGNTVHINEFHHIEVDWQKGTIRIYFSIGKQHVIEFDTLKDLFKSTPHPMRLANEKEIRIQYEELCQEKKIPLLESLQNGKSLSPVSPILFDSKTKDITRMMRAFEYLFKYHIVRLWKENILNS